MQVKQELENIVVNQAITFDGTERTVIAVYNLKELYQRSGSNEWLENNKESKAILLSGNVWLFRIPSKELGEYVWFKTKEVTYASNLSEFFKGNDSDPGPARKFAKAGQSVEIPFNLFNKDLFIVDIGAFKINCQDNDKGYLYNNDRVYFVTAKSKDSKEWLLYLDARRGEAKGTGGSFLGEVFKPEADIETIL